jgi:hypothetical protein
MKQERRGLRLLFDASAEVAPEGSPSDKVVARVTELSLHGCYIQTSAPFPVNAQILVKILHASAYFQAKAKVLYVNAASGMGVTFRELNPHCQSVLQKWLLLALRNQTSELGQP